MGQRLDLHALLTSITPNVYFQKPPTMGMQYPCIIYKRSSERVQHANDAKYHKRKQYQVTVIDEDPDSSIPDTVGELPLCSFDRHFTADNLNHDVYRLFF